MVYPHFRGVKMFKNMSSTDIFVYCHPAYLTYMQSTSWETLGWRKQKLESRLLGKISVTSGMQMTPPYGRKWRGTKEPLDESERGSEKTGLKSTFKKLRSWHLIPSISHEVMGPDAMTLVFWMLSLSQLFHFLFHFHQEAL